MKIRDPLVELKETVLYRALANQSAEYAERIEKFVSEVAPILATTQQYFPYYTRHDAHHGFRVVERIAQVVDSKCLVPGTPESLGQVELFLLIAAAYSHDLGMTVFPGEEADIQTKVGIKSEPGWQTNLELQKYLRQEHSKRGGTYVREHHELFGVPYPLTAPLDDLMRSHNMTVSQLSAWNKPWAAMDRVVDLRQLAAIVCVGDALEFSDTRVVDGVFALIDADPSEEARRSHRENMKHVCVGDNLAIDDYGRVVVSGTFTDPDVLALAHVTFDDIEGWAQGYSDIDRISKVPRLRVNAEPFIRNLRYPTGRFERLGIRLNRKSVIELIASRSVWRGETGHAVRELIQNAVEACRFRAHHARKSDNYKPAVRVEFNSHDRTIVVEDNGCGMSQRTVLNNFLTVGSSRAKEPGYADDDYAPIARFGIGFWSVFTVAKSASVGTRAFDETSTDDGKGASGFTFNVSLDHLKEYTVFESSQREIGTRVELSVPKEIDIEDVYFNGKGTIVCSEIPLTFVLDGVEFPVPETVPDVDEFDVFGERTQLLASGEVKLFNWRGKHGNTELALGLAYRIDDKGRASFLAPDSSALSMARGGIKFPRHAVCGFASHIGRNSESCIDFSRVGYYVSNALSPKGFEFSIERQSLLDDKASESYALEVTKLLNDGYREFLASTGSNQRETIAELRHQSALNGGDVCDTFTGKELEIAQEHYADLTVFTLQPVCRSKVEQPKPRVFMDFSELRASKGTVLMIQQHAEVRVTYSSSRFMDANDVYASEILMDAAQKWLENGDLVEPVYLMRPERLGSMLFDSDPQSTLRFISTKPFGSVCVQVIDANRLDPKATYTNIIAEVHGRWSGAVYRRAFSVPNGKPYYFLGRHRVVVSDGSTLCKHMEELAKERKLQQIANLVAKLQEDGQGFSSPAIEALLKNS